MKKIIMLAMVVVFLWAGVSFAENWIMFFKSDQFNAFFDADRVVKKGKGYDYWVVGQFERMGTPYQLSGLFMLVPGIGFGN